MRLRTGRGGVFVAAVLLAGCTFRIGAQQIPGASTDSVAALARGEWPTYADLCQREVLAARSDQC